MSRRRNDPWARLLPAGLDAPPELSERNEQAANALAGLESARAAHREAVEHAEQAPRQDADTAAAAYRAGKKPPTPSADKAQQAAEAARLAEQAASAEVDAQLAELGRLVVAHRGALIEGAGSTLIEVADRIVGHLDALAGEFDELGRTSALVRSLHRFDPREGRTSFAAPAANKARPLIAQLREAATAERENATPLPARIVEEVGEHGAGWNEVAAALGRKPLDEEACQHRDLLVQAGELEWIDADGTPLRDRDPRAIIGHRRLVRSSPRESATQRARRKRRERVPS